MNRLHNKIIPEDFPIYLDEVQIRQIAEITWNSEVPKIGASEAFNLGRIQETNLLLALSNLIQCVDEIDPQRIHSELASALDGTLEPLTKQDTSKIPGKIPFGLRHPKMHSCALVMKKILGIRTRESDADAMDSINSAMPISLRSVQHEIDKITGAIQPALVRLDAASREYCVLYNQYALSAALLFALIHRMKSTALPESAFNAGMTIDAVQDRAEQMVSVISVLPSESILKRQFKQDHLRNIANVFTTVSSHVASTIETIDSKLECEFPTSHVLHKTVIKSTAIFHATLAQIEHEYLTYLSPLLVARELLALARSDVCSIANLNADIGELPPQTHLHG